MNEGNRPDWTSFSPLQFLPWLRPCIILIAGQRCSCSSSAIDRNFAIDLENFLESGLSWEIGKIADQRPVRPCLPAPSNLEYDDSQNLSYRRPLIQKSSPDTIDVISQTLT